MKRSIALKIAAVQEQAAKDPRYLELWKEYRIVSADFLDLLERLPRKEASIVEDYLGLTEEMHRYLLELASQ